MLFWAKKEVWLSFEQCSYVVLEKAYSIAPIQCYYNLIRWAKGALPRALPPAETDVHKFFSGCNTGLSRRKLTESKGK